MKRIFVCLVLFFISGGLALSFATASINAAAPTILPTVSPTTSSTISPTVSPTTFPTMFWADEFDASALKEKWSWVREDSAYWSLTQRPGFLVINTQVGSVVGTGNQNKNMLLQDMPVGDFEIQTHLVFTPTQNYHFAGLLLYEDDDNFIRFGRGYCLLSGVTTCQGGAIYFNQEISGTVNIIMTPTVTAGDIYLRVAKQETAYTGYFSDDGANWILLGTYHGSTPTKIGLMAESSTGGASTTPAAFDYFWVGDNRYRTFLPLIFTVDVPIIYWHL
ncbi:MAG: DUF1349 domain-containing protein [Anaerolineae bacterium]|nr:DUF1349 domain-containing protein [Anaerolineae bacterium]